MIEPLVAQEKALREAVAKLATADQAKAAGATREMVLDWLDRIGLGPGSPGALSTSAGSVPVRWTSLDVLNALTMFGLIAIGVCLMLGFLTPLAALSAAAFLAMIYFSMPPWPGLPPNPEGRGALPVREQKPDRADRLPGDRHHAERSLGRPRCTLLRCAPPAPAGGARGQRSRASTQ